MSDIPPISASTTLPGTPPAQPTRSAPATAPAGLQDRVEISQVAQSLSTLELGDDVRVDKVLAIREAIANGTYETPEKLDIAIGRLIEDLRSDS